MQEPTWTVERHAELPSTQDRAKELARNGAPHGTVVVAERMTKGRGQHGNAWHAPEGGLYLSVVLRGIPDARLLTLALGNAVGDVLEVAGAEPQLKWVNDVLVDGKKIAGILVEGESTGSTVDFMVAGIGVNVNGSAASFPRPLAGGSTTLQDALGCDSCVPDLESFLLQSLEAWVDRVRTGANAEVVAAWRARDALKGKRAVLEGFRPQPVEGVCHGIADDGALLFQDNGRVEHVHAGRVRLA